MRRLPLTLLLLLLVSAAGRAQAPDPLIGYLISADEFNWWMGGYLGSAHPRILNFPEDGHREGIRFFHAGVTAQGTYADYYRTGGMEGYGASFRRRAAGTAFMTGQNRVAWNAEATSEAVANRLSFSSGGPRQTATGSATTWLTGLSGSVRLSPFMLGSGLRLGPQQRPEPFAGVGVKFRRADRLEVFWERRYLNFDTDILWRSEHARFEIGSMREGVDGWLLLYLRGTLRLELRGSRHLWVRDKDVSLSTTLEPWGDDWSYHGFVKYERKRWAALAGLRGQSTALQAYGMKGELPYAKITHADLDIRAWFASLTLRPIRQHHQYLVESERLEWTGYSRGHTEFWPFTSGLADLLGLRRYFVADASGYLWRLHLAVSGPLKGDWSGGASVNLVDAHPSATFRHWRPEYLAFGVADEQINELRLYHLIAGMASLSVTYHHAPWEVRYAVHQIVPLKSWSHPAPTAEPSTEPAEGKSSRAYGGAFHQLTFGWQI